MSAALIREHQSFVLVIDIQARLAPAINQHQEVIRRNQWLLGIADELTIPIWYTEQYPKGLGHTVDALMTWQTPTNTLEKSHFSAWDEPSIRTHLSEQAGQRRQVILTGTEAHVCVLQTALGLLADDWQVFVVADAVGSRRADDKAIALQRLRDAGAVIVTSEMVAFEWLNDSATDRFKSISRNFFRAPV